MFSSFLSRITFLVLGAIFISLYSHAQRLELIGSFKRPENRGRVSYLTDVNLIYDWDSGKAMAIEEAKESDVVAVHAFNDDLTPKAVYDLTLTNTNFKSLSPIANYVKDGIHYVLVEFVKRTNIISKEQALDYAVIASNINTGNCTINPLQPIEEKLEERRKVWQVFAHKQAFWMLTYSNKAELLELHRFDADTYRNTRALTLSDELQRHIVEKGIFTRKTSRADLRFAEPRLDFVPDDVFRLLIGPVNDELVLLRASPKPDTATRFYAVRFGIDNTDVSVTPFTYQAGLFDVRNLFIYQGKLILTQFIYDRLFVQIRSLDKPNEPLQKRSYHKSDTTVAKLIMRTSRTGSFWEMEKTKDVKNPFAKFNYGDEVNAFAFTSRKNELILGFTRYIHQSSNGMAMNGITMGQGSSTTYHNISLRLNPESLELYQDPNGPLYDKRSDVNEKIKKLQKTESVEILSRVTLRDGGELLLGLYAGDNTFKVYRTHID